MVGLKTVTYAKLSPKMVKPRDKAVKKKKALGNFTPRKTLFIILTLQDIESQHPKQNNNLCTTFVDFSERLTQKKRKKIRKLCKTAVLSFAL